MFTTIASLRQPVTQVGSLYIYDRSCLLHLIWHLRIFNSCTDMYTDDETTGDRATLTGSTSDPLVAASCATGLILQQQLGAATPNLLILHDYFSFNPSLPVHHACFSFYLVEALVIRMNPFVGNPALYRRLSSFNKVHT